MKHLHLIKENYLIKIFLEVKLPYQFRIKYIILLLFAIASLNMSEKSSTVNFRSIRNDNIRPNEKCNLLVAGSVSVMNRICYDAMSRKKTRLEALAASRERDLGSDSDSDQEEAKVLEIFVIKIAEFTLKFNFILTQF